MRGVGAALLLYAGPHGGRVIQMTVDSWLLGGVRRSRGIRDAMGLL